MADFPPKESKHAVHVLIECRVRKTRVMFERLEW